MPQITRLANRSNVLPVITRSDTLTLAQRQTVRHALRRDLAAAGLKWGSFDSLERRGRESAVDDEDDESSDPEADEPTESIQPEHGLSNGKSAQPGVPPFFLFSPEESGPIDPDATDEPPKSTTSSGTPFTRSFPWCSLDALNPAHSDFARMYSSLLGPLLMVRTPSPFRDCILTYSGPSRSSRTKRGTHTMSDIARSGSWRGRRRQGGSELCSMRKRGTRSCGRVLSMGCMYRQARLGGCPYSIWIVHTC